MGKDMHINISCNVLADLGTPLRVLWLKVTTRPNTYPCPSFTTNSDDTEAETTAEESELDADCRYNRTIQEYFTTTVETTQGETSIPGTGDLTLTTLSTAGRNARRKRDLSRSGKDDGKEVDCKRNEDACLAVAVGTLSFYVPANDTTTWKERQGEYTCVGGNGYTCDRKRVTIHRNGRLWKNHHSPLFRAM